MYIINWMRKKSRKKEPKWLALCTVRSGWLETVTSTTWCWWYSDQSAPWDWSPSACCSVWCWRAAPRNPGEGGRTWSHLLSLPAMPPMAASFPMTCGARGSSEDPEKTLLSRRNSSGSGPGATDFRTSKGAPSMFSLIMLMIRLLHVFITVNINVINNNECLSGCFVRLVHRFIDCRLSFLFKFCWNFRCTDHWHSQLLTILKSFD